VSGLPPIGSDARAGRLAFDEHDAGAFKRRETFSGAWDPAPTRLPAASGAGKGRRAAVRIDYRSPLCQGMRCPETWVKRRLALGADHLVCAPRTEQKDLLTALVPVEGVQPNYSREES
jgi:hypothetical protein